MNKDEERVQAISKDWNNLAGMPLGIVNSGALVSTSRATAGTIGVADVVGMWARLIPGCHARAYWLVNPDSLPTIYQLSLGTASETPMFVPAGGLSQSPYPILLGRPMIISDLVPSLASANSLMLVDFSYYLLITKGQKVDTSMHLRFDYDETVYRMVARLDGQPMLSSSITPKTGSNALSAYVGLTA